MGQERTLSPEELKNAATLPSTPDSRKDARTEQVGPGVQVGSWRVEAKLSAQNGVQVFRGRGQNGRNCALKFYADAVCPDPDAIRVLQAMQIPGMPELYETGVWQGRRYECMQLVQGVPLDTVQLTPELVEQKVLPTVLRAMLGLRDCGLRHNDIKPANLLWDAQNEQVWLIDYGTLTRSDATVNVGGTPGFMAPELLLYNTEKRTEASEVCSFGLTMLQLFAGRPLIRISGDQKQALMQARRFWQHEMALPMEVPPALCQPMRRCVSRNAGERPRLEELATAVGLQREKTARDAAPEIIPLRVGGKSALSVGQLLDLLAEDWAGVRALLACGRVERFLVQFGGSYYACAERCRAEMEWNLDAALFHLSQELQPREQILWLGQCYQSLQAFQAAAEQDGDAALQAFLRGKCLSFYLEINHQDPGMIEFARELERPENADVAIVQLKSALSGTPDVEVCGHRLSGLQDLFRLLYGAICNDQLDDTVQQLLRSEDFVGWLDRMGLGNVLPDVQKVMEGTNHEF